MPNIEYNIGNYSKELTEQIMLANFYILGGNNIFYGLNEKFLSMYKKIKATAKKSNIDIEPYCYENITKNFDYITIIKTIVAIPPMEFRALDTVLTDFENVEILRAVCEEQHDKYYDILTQKCGTLMELITHLYKKNNYSVDYDESDLQIYAYKNLDSRIRKEYFKEHKQNFYQQIIADRFFKDTQKNMFLNLDANITFYRKFKSLLTKKEEKLFLFALDIKNQISVLNNQTEYSDFLYVYEKFKDSKIEFDKLMYELFETSKKITAEVYLGSCSKFSDYPFETTKENVKIIHVSKKPFKMFISTTMYPKIGRFTYKNSDRAFDLLSTSYVSNESLITYGNLQEKIAFGYNSFNPKHLIVINKNDNYTQYTRKWSRTVSNLCYDFMLPNELLSYSKSTNEINECNFYYPTDERDLPTSVKPNCIFSLGYPTKNEIKLAKKLDIPIFQIENKEYQPVKTSVMRTDYENLL